MKKGVLLLVIVLALAVFGWFLLGNDSDKMESDEVVPTDVVPTDVIEQEATLEAVGTYIGSGSAESSYDGKMYSHKVTADIGDPAEGKFYEGWLVGGFGFVSTGKMVKEGNQYVLQFESQEDMSSYKKVVITEETEANGLDNNPEAHVLEGNF
jgi:hypothetical protein|tara:strand:- start:60 stop:518 length:459 start_codon:yes stop_codon:yes gene_type:complete